MILRSPREFLKEEIKEGLTLNPAGENCNGPEQLRASIMRKSS